MGNETNCGVFFYFTNLGEIKREKNDIDVVCFMLVAAMRSRFKLP